MRAAQDSPSRPTSPAAADAEGLARRLREHRVVVIAPRPHLLRISTACYNDEEDVRVLLDALGEAIR